MEYWNNYFGIFACSSRLLLSLLVRISVPWVHSLRTEDRSPEGQPDNPPHWLWGRHTAFYIEIAYKLHSGFSLTPSIHQSLHTVKCPFQQLVVFPTPNPLQSPFSYSPTPSSTFPCFHSHDLPCFVRREGGSSWSRRRGSVYQDPCFCQIPRSLIADSHTFLAGQTISPVNVTDPIPIAVPIWKSPCQR